MVTTLFQYCNAVLRWNHPGFDGFQQGSSLSLLFVVCVRSWTGRFATTTFSATQICKIVATLFRMVTTLFQYCNAVLLWNRRCESSSVTSPFKNHPGFDSFQQGSNLDLLFVVCVRSQLRIFPNSRQNGIFHCRISLSSGSCPHFQVGNKSISGGPFPGRSRYDWELDQTF